MVWFLIGLNQVRILPSSLLWIILSSEVVCSLQCLGSPYLNQVLILVGFFFFYWKDFHVVFLFHGLLESQLCMCLVDNYNKILFSWKLWRSVWVFHILPSLFSSSKSFFLRNLCEGGEEAKDRDMKRNVKCVFDFAVSRVGIGAFPENLKRCITCPMNSQLIRYWKFPLHLCSSDVPRAHETKVPFKSHR